MNAARSPHDPMLTFASPSGQTTGSLSMYRKGSMLCARVDVKTPNGPAKVSVCIDEKLASAAHKLARPAWERWAARLKSIATASDSVMSAGVSDGSYDGAVSGALRSALERQGALESVPNVRMQPPQFGQPNYKLQTGGFFDNLATAAAHAVEQGAMQELAQAGPLPLGITPQMAQQYLNAGLNAVGLPQTGWDPRLAGTPLPGQQRELAHRRAYAALPHDVKVFLTVLAAAAGNPDARARVQQMHARGDTAPWAHAAHSLLMAPTTDRRLAIARWFKHPHQARTITHHLEKIAKAHPGSSVASQWQALAEAHLPIAARPMAAGAPLPFTGEDGNALSPLEMQLRFGLNRGGGMRGHTRMMGSPNHDITGSVAPAPAGARYEIAGAAPGGGRYEIAGAAPGGGRYEIAGDAGDPQAQPHPHHGHHPHDPKHAHHPHHHLAGDHTAPPQQSTSIISGAAPGGGRYEIAGAAPGGGRYEITGEDGLPDQVQHHQHPSDPQHPQKFRGHHGHHGQHHGQHHGHHGHHLAGDHTAPQETQTTFITGGISGHLRVGAISSRLRVGDDDAPPSVSELDALPIDVRSIVACVLAECGAPIAHDLVADIMRDPNGMAYLEHAEQIAASGHGRRHAFASLWCSNPAVCKLLCATFTSAARLFPACHVAKAWADTCTHLYPEHSLSPADEQKVKNLAPPSIGAFAHKAYYDMGRHVMVGEDAMEAAKAAPAVSLAKAPGSPEANLIASRALATQLESMHNQLPDGHGELIGVVIEKICRALRLLDIAGRDPAVRDALKAHVRAGGRKGKELKAALVLAEELRTKGTVALPPVG